MMDVSRLDNNFVVNASFDTSGLTLYNAAEAPFEIYGIIPPSGDGDVYKRMPSEVAKTVSENVHRLSLHTAGGRVRFKTNSRAFAIFAKMHSIGKMPHFALTGSAGFDMYVNNRFNKTVFVPPFNISDGYSGIIWIPGSEEKNIEINFPLYSGVSELIIGLEGGATVSSPEPYSFDEPVVYYGSSITQGGCACRPGNAYESTVSRRLNLDHINLGFSGSAKGERAIAEYISGLKMKIFVYDYDHNADSPEMLESTHAKMFKIIREKNPCLPIIMMTRPKFYTDLDTERRAAVVKSTYEQAIKSGDKNAYFIDGVEMMHGFDELNDGMTVDAWHPNDFGFALMARSVGDVIEKILNKEKQLT